MYIVIAVIIFGILIASHELGHFLAAKASGVKVLEFSLGMGPVLLKKQGKETLYSLRAFPVGGFCAMEGEDENSADPRAFGNQSAIKRLIILFAGAAMNFLLGFLLIIIIFANVQSFSAPKITGFMDGFPYEGEQGFLEGDTIYKINGERIYFSSNVSTFLERRSGDTADIVLIRDGEKVYLNDFNIVPHEFEQDGQTVLKYGLYFESSESGAWARLKYSWYCSLDFARMARMGFADLVTGAVGVKELSGPVGIVSIINNVGNESDTFMDAIGNIAYLWAFIAINLAVVNLLPIPALDGGRILFLVINWVAEKMIRRKINPKYEGYVHAAGLVLLLGLMVFVMFNDIVRIIGV
jgi:regulator of sigma E protease